MTATPKEENSFAAVSGERTEKVITASGPEASHIICGEEQGRRITEVEKCRQVTSVKEYL